MIISWPKGRKALLQAGLGLTIVAAITSGSTMSAWAQQAAPPAAKPADAAKPTEPAKPSDVVKPAESVKPAPAAQAAPPAPAQSAPPAPASAGKNETPAVVLNDEDVTSVLSQPVFSVTGENMGHVVDVLVDRKADIRAVIIDFGGFLGVGSRKVAVDWHALQFPPKGKLDHLILSINRKEVQLAPEYKPGEPIVVLRGSNATPPPSASAATPIAPGK